MYFAANSAFLLGVPSRFDVFHSSSLTGVMPLVEVVPSMVEVAKVDLGVGSLFSVVPAGVGIWLSFV